VLDDVSFDLAAGQGVGILGESGAGKTTLSSAITGLLPDNAEVTHGSVQFRGIEMLRVRASDLEKVRGAQISFIPQEPETTLNPVMRVGQQINEVLRAHTSVPTYKRKGSVCSMLEAAGLSDPGIYFAYPHQLSGGQRQRVAIAQALICKPCLLIADEPTSSLDNVIQAEVLRLLTRLKQQFQLALIFITHNPALLHGLVDRALVLHQGRIVETTILDKLFSAPDHSVTQAILRSIPPLPIT
jgi:ABC-type glutathione transport system ATPase component